MITMDEFLKLVVNGSGALAVSFLAFHSMDKRDQLFTKTINDYLKESIKTKEKLASKLQELANASREQKDANTELKHAVEHMYKELVKRSKTIKECEERIDNMTVNRNYQ